MVRTSCSYHYLCLSVVSDVMGVPAAAVDPPGWGSSPSEEISWTLTFPLPLSSHNIPLLLQLRIRIKEENKDSCCNILWGFWHHQACLFKGWSRLCCCLFHFWLLQLERAAWQSTDDGMQRVNSWRGHGRKQSGGPDGAAEQQTSAPLCQERAQNTGGNSFMEMDAWISVNVF